jgi:hypothetical protein
MALPSRKLPRFYIINPVNDRRLECRFESQEPVEVKDQHNGKTTSAIALEIGKQGLKLETSEFMDVGKNIQVEFHTTNDHVGCFGYIAWTRRKEEGDSFESGVSIDAWHGIIQGEESWKKFKGIKPKRDRRRKTR